MYNHKLNHLGPSQQSPLPHRAVSSSFQHKQVATIFNVIFINAEVYSIATVIVSQSCLKNTVITAPAATVKGISFRKSTQMQKELSLKMPTVGPHRSDLESSLTPSLNCFSTSSFRVLQDCWGILQATNISSSSDEIQDSKHKAKMPCRLKTASTISGGKKNHYYRHFFRTEV